MFENFKDRISHAWNAFKQTENYADLGPNNTYRQSKNNYRVTFEKTILPSIYNRISVDAATMDIKHCRVDSDNGYLETIPSGLNEALTLSPNLDQNAQAFMIDVVMSMLDEGVVAIVPIDTNLDPSISGGYDIYTLRVGKIVDWYPSHVKINLYDVSTGTKKDICLPKKTVAIVENPFYSVMNETNSTLKRLRSTLSLLDTLDNEAASGKFNIIFQLPFSVKTDLRKQQAEKRLTELENQLMTSKYGTAYIDSTEKITQLNRPLENNLLPRVEYLTKMLFSQLSITEDILSGKADEKTMINYYNRTIEPILHGITLEMKRKFLTKTARTQRQSITFFRDPFKLVPVGELSEIADKFTRNEILSPNDVRSAIGLKPSPDPKANELRNRNMPGAEPIVETETEDLPVEDVVDTSYSPTHISDINTNLGEGENDDEKI